MVRERLAVYRNKKVFVTGHTGFKGSWLVAMLKELGCEIYGYALEPPAGPNHYELVGSGVNSCTGDIRDLNKLTDELSRSGAEFLFHLAAQSLVRASYQDPLYTYEVNVMGSLHVLEAVRRCSHVKAVLMVTTDKVYANRETHYAYKETDRLGGHDLYSSSKACCELLTDSFRLSYLNPADYGVRHQTLIATVRAGNVIGGGDWSVDRLIPDLVKAASKNISAEIRHPEAIRPWQHVLDCLGAYLAVGAGLYLSEVNVASAWNIAPDPEDVHRVDDILRMCTSHWPAVRYCQGDSANEPHEAGLLMLDSSRIRDELHWTPKYHTADAVRLTMEWYRQFYEHGAVVTSEQVENYLAA